MSAAFLGTSVLGTTLLTFRLVPVGSDITLVVSRFNETNCFAYITVLTPDLVARWLMHLPRDETVQLSIGRLDIQAAPPLQPENRLSHGMA